MSDNTVDAVVGRIPITDLSKIFGDAVVKRKRNTKLQKRPKHELYMVIGKSAVLVESEEGQKFLSERMFGKKPAAASLPGIKPDSLPAQEKPAEPKRKSLLDRIAEEL